MHSFVCMWGLSHISSRFDHVQPVGGPSKAWCCQYPGNVCVVLTIFWKYIQTVCFGLNAQCWICVGYASKILIPAVFAASLPSWHCHWNLKGVRLNLRMQFDNVRILCLALVHQVVYTNEINNIVSGASAVWGVCVSQKARSAYAVCWWLWCCDYSNMQTVTEICNCNFMMRCASWRPWHNVLPVSLCMLNILCPRCVICLYIFRLV